MRTDTWLSRRLGTNRQAPTTSGGGQGAHTQYAARVDRPGRARRARLARIGAAGVVIVGGLLGIPGATGSAQAAAQGPCDIYAAGGTPCVAAHSTTRALYGAYNGPLYQVRRASDNAMKDIGVLAPGGVADAAAQDAFCAGTTCLITVLYDQSGKGNNLTQAPGGSHVGGPDNLADATAAPTLLNGQKTYGLFVAPGTGYRNDNTTGIATGDQPEGIYDVIDGTHSNHGCCFDYGNAETDPYVGGAGQMEAIYFGGIKVWGTGAGSGPWIMADMENGLFSGVSPANNANDPTITFRYTTAIVKGTANLWAIRAGNAQNGGLSTFYSGVRPDAPGYNPMSKKGGIVLGIGGDNSKGGDGTFYEGVMTAGYPSDATENAVQANITAAGYGVGGAATTGEVHAVGAGKCLDVPRFSTTNGTQTQIYTCNGGSNQIWTHTSDNRLTVTMNGTTMCLDARAQGTTPGTKVQTWACTGQANQKWNLNSNGTITGVQSGLCLDVSGASTADGALVDLWTCNGGANQKWTQ